ncbi:10 kDa chaperonin, partial [Haemophilus influenzae]
HA